MLVTNTVNLSGTMASSTTVESTMARREVADHLNVIERTVYQLAGATQILALKVGGSWRFSKADIDTWIKSQSSTDGKEG